MNLRIGRGVYFLVRVVFSVFFAVVFGAVDSIDDEFDDVISVAMT